MGDGTSSVGGKPPPESASFDRIARSLTTAATIVGLFVTGNTLLNSCSRERIDRANSFRAAVTAEEAFWNRLYAQYLAAVTDANPDMEQRRVKLMAIAMQATHRNPDFKEFGIDGRSRDANAQLDRMRQLLLEALTDPRNSSPAIAQDIGFFLDDKSAIRERVAAGDAGGTPPQVTQRAQEATTATSQQNPVLITPADPGAASEVIPFHETRILASGSKTGWDVDVFWCAGAGERETFGRAIRVGKALSGAAVANTAIAPGVMLGRIRIRSLPVEQQNSGYFYTGGDAVVADSGRGEAAAALALGRFIGQKAQVPMRQVSSVGTVTNWYLSVFVCSSAAGTGPAVADSAATAVRAD